jgi:hypothetical protein
MIGMRFPLESVAQILFWRFDAVENPAYMRSVTACAAAITPVSVPSYVWTILPELAAVAVTHVSDHQLGG